MRHLLIQLAATTALVAGAVQAGPRLQQDEHRSEASSGVILAQSSGGEAGGHATGMGPASRGGGAFSPAYPGAVETGPDGDITGSIGLPFDPEPNSNTEGGGGTNGDSGTLVPGRSPPNAPVAPPPYSEITVPGSGAVAITPLAPVDGAVDVITG